MADTIIAASLQLDPGNSNETVKSFKTELREANENLIQIQKNFGETSPEAIKTAQAVAQLRDRMDDARQLSDAFNPDAKFTALSGAIRGVTGGFTALTGVMALFGEQNK